jgi:hypothetical protein
MFRIVLLLLMAAILPGCAAKLTSDPITTLGDTTSTPPQLRLAMDELQATAPDDPATIQALQRVITRPGYTIDIREDAFARLERHDVDELKKHIRRTLPQLGARGWLERLCEIIAERGWTDLSPALVSSWARPGFGPMDDLERAEYKALATLHGPDHVTEVVFQMFLESRKVAEQGLRARCWDLLHRLGQRERLLALITQSDPPADDAMLIDLHAAATELGLTPHNREEILWLRKLREPERAEFWSSAVQAVQGLSPERRLELEIRDLPVLVSASRHDPELLAMSNDEMYRKLEAALKGRPVHVQNSNYAGISDITQQKLYEYRGKLTWGDLAAMLIAVRAMDVPEVVTHLFRYAERDRADETTEYGGVIAMDAKDRFEILEFPPVVRYNDVRFESSQAMLDAAYTAIFHFHYHVQRFENDDFAGPGYGDHNYANNTRANCMVFTFVNKDELNVDYYRHDSVVVDLGNIER